MMIGLAFVVVAVLAAAAAGRKCTERRKGLRLYKQAWNAVLNNFYEADLLSDWASWEHKFDKQISCERDARQFITEMLSSLNDDFTRILTRDQARELGSGGTRKWVGVGVAIAAAGSGWRITGLLDGGPAMSAGLKVGDILVSVGDRQVDNTEGEYVDTLLRGRKGTDARIVVLRDGATLSFSVPRRPISFSPVQAQSLENGLVLLTISSFDSENTALSIMMKLSQLANPAGIIIDLRDNTGGLTSEAIYAASLFLRRGVITSYVEHNAELREFVTRTISAFGATYLTELTERADGSRESDRMGRLPFLNATTPIVLLVNEYTASAAELFAAALQENGRATTVGTRTLGKGIGQTVVTVSGARSSHNNLIWRAIRRLLIGRVPVAHLMITAIRTSTPKGNWLGDAQNQRFGLTPNVVAERMECSEGKDNQLEVAISVISD